MRISLIGLTLFCALGSMLRAQSPNVNRAEDEFPGLQVLPPGSKVKGLSLPRYEGNKVTALLQADMLEVVSRSELALSNIRAALYADNGETTTVKCAQAGYDFRKKAIVAPAKAEVVHPNFTLSGVGVIFSTYRRVGFVKGPVRTTIRSAKTPPQQ